MELLDTRGDRGGVYDSAAEFGLVALPKMGAAEQERSTKVGSPVSHFLISKLKIKRCLLGLSQAVGIFKSRNDDMAYQ